MLGFRRVLTSRASACWAFAALVMGALAAGCADHGSTPSLQPHDRERMSLVSPAPTGIYLTAAVNVNSGEPDDYAPSFQQQENDTEALEGLMPGPGGHRYLAMHVEYRSWSELGQLANDAEIKGDIARGRIPVISLHCGDDLTAHGGPYDIIGIGNGSADQDIQTLKTDLQGLTKDGQPYPVMLRWFWEFNVNAHWPMPTDPNNPNGPNGNNCYEQPGANNNPPDFPTQFITAWDRIKSIIAPTGSGGNPNVTFVWNPAVDDAADGPPSPGPFYPGNTEVDWLGLDGYSKEDTNNNDTPLNFDGIFENSVNTYSSSTYEDKPIIISENADCQQYPAPYDQATYLGNVQGELDGDIDGSLYSHVRAYGYFDSASSEYHIPSLGNELCKWYFDTSGQAAFITISGDSNFVPMAQTP